MSPRPSVVTGYMVMLPPRLCCPHHVGSCTRYIRLEAASARVIRARYIKGARRDIGIDPLAPQLIINWRLTHEATP
jgi:hypothetical protein